VCWNGDAGLCEACAPNFQEEMTAAHAQAKAEAARQQLQEKAAKTDYVADIDMSAGASLHGPTPATAAHDRCTACGAAAGSGRFCAQCGAPRPAPGCPGCGTAIAPNTRFCASCGHKLA